MGMLLKHSYYKSKIKTMTDYSQPGPWSTVKANWPNMLVWVAVFILGTLFGHFFL